MIGSVAWLILQAVLLGAAFAPAHAQSEFLGERFPYQAFDRLPNTPLTVGGGTLNVAFAPGEFVLPRSALMSWLEKSAQAAAVYFGKFPVASVRILIVPVRGGGVQNGTSFGHRGAAIRLLVGSASTEADLRDDWKAGSRDDPSRATRHTRAASLAGRGDRDLCRADCEGAGRRSESRGDLGRHGARLAERFAEAG
jgi:hypothetical protein